jgi:hypothetical protein
MTKKHWTDALADNIPNSDMFKRSLAEIKKDLNDEYPKLLKAIESKKLTPAQKKQAAMEFIRLLEEFAEEFDYKKDS